MKNFPSRLIWFLPWWATLVAVRAQAALPPELAAALHYLKDQTSYSWEFINGDPGVVAQNIETPRGNFLAMKQSLTPHVLGRLVSTGDALFRRDWPDGLQMDTLVAANGEQITHMPEGWMTAREILDALADEQVRNDAATPRSVWLKRADRPFLRRPDQELGVFLRGEHEFEISGDAYTTKLEVSAGGADKSTEDSPSPMTLIYTLHVTDGVIRTYEVHTEYTRTTDRARVKVPSTDDLLAIVTYLPVAKLDVPEEAWGKLKAAP
jgi:hypothetical protein